MGVSPHYIASSVGLEVPGRYDDYIAFADPNASLHLAADSAEPFCAVLAFDHYAVKT
jgi:hypothetical protein